MRRLNGKLVRRAVGRFPIIPLAAAREAALAALRDIECGIDPYEKKAAQRRAESQRTANSFSIVAEEFIARHVRKLKSGRDAEQVIRRELVPPWGGKPVTAITRRDVIAVLERIAISGRPYAARKVFAYVTKFFSWCLARGIVETSPAAAIKSSELIGAKHERQRVLADAELAALWQATGSLGYPVMPFVRLLLITGQRLREVAEMTWSEVDLDKAMWSIPASRMKGGAGHEVPLPPMAVDTLKSLPRFTDGAFVFSASAGKRPIGAFSRIKNQIDAALPEPLAPWRFHDLRRSFRTGLGALPVPPNVSELLIAHRQAGLHRTYDLHSYRDEKARAMGLWAAKLAGIVEPGESNVVSLASRG